MDYSKLADLYEKLEGTTKKLEKTRLLAEFLKKAPEADLPSVALLCQGKVFPSHSEEEIGVASKLMAKAIAKVFGVPEQDVMAKLRQTGDYGKVAEHFAAHKRQLTLGSERLRVKAVHEKLKLMPCITGSGSIDRKLGIVAKLLTNAKPKEARYIVRTVLGTMRVGVAEGLMRDAIAQAFKIDVRQVESAYEIMNDYGEVARVAKKGKGGLAKAKVQVGRPLKVMLAQKADGIGDAIKRLGRAQYEFKIDGMRVQVHKAKGKITVYTRRLDNVTRQFPDIAKMVAAGVRGTEFIIEGEAVATNPRTGKPLPFQKLSRRIKRKYEIEEMVKAIPVKLHLFDLLYFGGKSYLGQPFSVRRAKLEKIVRASSKLGVTEKLVSDDAKKIEKFYRRSLHAGQEGIMAKNREAAYKPGSRVGYMLKIKPTMEHLDLVVIGADWGQGRRTKWFGSLYLACYDAESGKFLGIGKLGTGLTDRQFEDMTEKLKPLVVGEKGKSVHFNPKVVVEVAYEEIQKSPTYSSGYALRFPRLINVRTDKAAKEANDLTYVEQLYRGQK